jgi:amino acid adenylation domain-containing protein
MLLGRFLEQCERAPHRVALDDGATRLSYGALLTRAQAVARVLARSGVRPRSRVTVLLHKDHDAVATIVGVLLLGAAYVPIDPRAPRLRIAQILDDCRPVAWIVAPSLLSRLRTTAPELCSTGPALLSLSECFAPSSSAEATWNATNVAEWQDEPSHPEDTAYILYTSGTTGQPKGVEISHRAATAFVNWGLTCFALDETDRVTSFAPLSFDLSIFDLFASLSVGATVILVAQERLLHPLELAEWLSNREVTTLYAVPSTIERLVTDGQWNSKDAPSLKRILYAGEPFPIPTLRAAMTALSGARFYNLFGPTETNVCTYHALTAIPSEDATAVPIGVPCEHLDVELRDENGNVVPQGHPGELYVAGPQVMTGYHGKPELSYAAFAPSTVPGDPRRFYRTGDFAKQDESGTYWFLGRRDRLIKRRGYRLELGEIEAALRRHEAVREVVAYAERDEDTVRVVAVVTLRDGAKASPLTLKAHSGTCLPPYLVPDAVEILAELPRTLTGKLDLLALQGQTAGNVA